MFCEDSTTNSVLAGKPSTVEADKNPIPTHEVPPTTNTDTQPKILTKTPSKTPSKILAGKKSEEISQDFFTPVPTPAKNNKISNPITPSPDRVSFH